MVILCCRTYCLDGTDQCGIPDTDSPAIYLSQMTNLITLTLSYHHFNPFPVVAEMMPGLLNLYLEHLQLSDNHIDLMIYGTSHLNYLERVSFANNVLEKIPSLVGSAETLLTLDVSYNMITRLVISDFIVLHHLTLLKVNGNPIVNIHELSTTPLPNLRSLNIR